MPVNWWREVRESVGLQREFPGELKGSQWLVLKIEFRAWLQQGGILKGE